MNPLSGIALALAATFVFSFMGALVRYFGQTMPVGQVVFARSFFAIIPLLIFLAWRKELTTALRVNSLFAHISRGITGVFGMFLNFAALALLPLADATAIGFAAPIFSVVLAAIFLGEVVRTRRWTAVVVGFIGVLIMLSPYLGSGSLDAGETLGAILAITGAFIVAVAMTQVRHLSRSETTGSLVFYFSLLCSLAAIVTVPWGWVMPNAVESLLLIAMGLLGGIGQILITESYRYASAGVIAPFAYTAMIYSIVIGYIWFGEVPEAIVLVGAVIVIGAGLFVIWRERQLGLDRTEEKRVEGPTG